MLQKEPAVPNFHQKCTTKKLLLIVKISIFILNILSKWRRTTYLIVFIKGFSEELVSPNLVKNQIL